MNATTRLVLFLSAAAAAVCPETRSLAADPVLENSCVALVFDRASGTLVALTNKLASEAYAIRGDNFGVFAEEFQIEPATAKLVSAEMETGAWRAKYEAGPLRIEAVYTLGAGHAFAQKRMSLRFSRECRLKRILVSRPAFFAPGLEIVRYRYPQFGRPVGTEPISTFFGRTPRGGFFTGLEMPFDASVAEDRQVALAYQPSLKIKAGEELVCEPAYFGVYRRTPGNAGPVHPAVRGSGVAVAPSVKDVLPSSSESDAMVAMTSAILGPPRHGLAPMACGWHCEMEQYAYPSDTAVEADMRSLDFISQCGIDWVSASHPWEGETEKMNALGENDHYTPGPRVRRFLEHARKVGVKVVMWPTMNHTHPWSAAGRPFRSDKPEWLFAPRTLDGKPDLIRQRAGHANCFANRALRDWLSRINAEGLATGYYDAWAMDGSFFGDGGWFTTIVPVDCAFGAHDHLPGDSNYACQRALGRLFADVRRQRPATYIFTCRPAQDLGVWALREVDACFTLLETGTGRSNIAAGDEIRTWSRVRVHHHFFPHYLDQPLLFPSRANRGEAPNWPSGKLDYILLSALSSSPNQLFYMPTKTGIPEQDKAEIRRWLDWGRKNVALLQVRKDLPDWPQPGKVDGSAHVRGDGGLVFLFNPGGQPLSTSFVLNEPCIGLSSAGRFAVRQEYPPSGLRIETSHGSSVEWQVPPQSAVVLRIEKAGQ